MNPESLFLLVAGLVLLTLGGDLLVRGASGIARRLGIPSLIIGLTVVAMGTSAPEFAVSLLAAIEGQGDIATGNIVGSNIFNTLFILGASALVAPLLASNALVRREAPLCLGITFLSIVLMADGEVGRLDGVILTAAFVSFLAVQVRNARRGKADAVPSGAEPAVSPIPLLALYVVGGLVLLVWGSNWLVGGAVDIALALGVDSLTIGLTIVAAGTSLPEVATSVIATWKGEREIAVGNVIGSNIFNLLGVMGLAALLSPLALPAGDVLLRADLWVLAASAALCLPIMRTGQRIDRVEGVGFLLAYVAYVVWLLLRSHQMVPPVTHASSALSVGAASFLLVLLALRPAARRPGV